jgi:hypothetical protein
MRSIENEYLTYTGLVTAERSKCCEATLVPIGSRGRVEMDLSEVTRTNPGAAYNVLSQGSMRLKDISSLSEWGK